MLSLWMEGRLRMPKPLAGASGAMILIFLLLAASDAMGVEDAPGGAVTAHAGAPALQGWVPFKAGPGEDIVIPVTVNGVAAEGLVETGTPRVTLDKRLASTLGLRLAQASALTGLSGDVSIEEGRLASLKVAMIDARDVAADIADFSTAMPFADAAFNVILGAQVFARAALQIDFDHAMLRFLPPGAARGGDGVATVRLDPVSGKLLTRLEIDGQPVERAEISTGQPSALRLSPAVWARVRRRGARVTDFASADLTGIAVNDYAILPEVRLGGQTVSGVTTIIDGARRSVLDADHVDALIGLDLLRRFNLVLDAPAGKLLVARREAPDPPAPKSTAGLQGTYGAGGYEIIHVMRGSPAAQAGLKDGARICAVDHAAVDAGWAGDDRARWSTGAVGRQVRLTLCSGEDKMLTLQDFY